MRTLSFGKYRGIQQCSTRGGALSILALDHRNNLRNALRPHAPDTITPAEMSGFKQQVTVALAPYASAVLLDPEVGAFQNIGNGAIPGSLGLVVAVEATGYVGDPQARQSELLPNWSPAKIKRMGGSAVKLLVYYHPDAPTAAAIEALVEEIGAACRDAEIPFMLEPLSYGLAPGQKKLKGDDLRRVVIETARRLAPLGVDILKAEFPIDISASPDERAWAAACAELSEASAAPWILLSASVDYETYLRQVAIACQQGASGVAAGRAVWQEAPELSGEERARFLTTTAAMRIERLTALCAALARPWFSFYAAPDAGPDYYQSY